MTYSGGMTRATHGQFIAQLDAIEQAAPADLTVVRLDPTGWSQMLLGEWQDGVVGGDGAWPVRGVSQTVALGRTRRKSFS